MAAKKNFYTSPRGVISGFNAIQKPALDFNKVNLEYQMRLAIPADQATAFIADMEALRDAKFDEVLAADKKLTKVLKKADVGTVEMDEEGEETGRILFRFKQTAEIKYKSKKTGKDEILVKKVDLFDSKGKPIREPLRIGSGSEVKASFEPNPYYSAKDKEVGISFNRLAAVFLLKLVEYEGSGGSASDYGYEPDADDGDDGFDGSAYTASEDTGGDAGGEEDF